MDAINAIIWKDKTITYKSPVPRFDRKTQTYVYDIITLYNVELVEFAGNKVYQGTTTKRGKKFAWCCPSQILTLETK